MSAKVAPVVTGISPREGPPGTRVTIRGENFGESAADLQSKFYLIAAVIFVLFKIFVA